MAIRKNASPSYNLFLGDLCVAVNDARREGLTKEYIQDSLRKFLKQLVGDGTIDFVMTSELNAQAKELFLIEVEATDPEKYLGKPAESELPSKRRRNQRGNRKVAA